MIQEIASLPSREELITKLVFLLKSPITRLVRGLGAIPQRFVKPNFLIRKMRNQVLRQQSRQPLFLLVLSR